jgi:hypothetical protein
MMMVMIKDAYGPVHICLSVLEVGNPHDHGVVFLLIVSDIPIGILTVIVIPIVIICIPIPILISIVTFVHIVILIPIVILFPIVIFIPIVIVIRSVSGIACSG